MKKSIKNTKFKQNIKIENLPLQKTILYILLSTTFLLLVRVFFLVYKNIIWNY